MTVVCVAYLVALVAFVLVYLGIYRPLYSHPFPGEIADVIPSLSTIRLVELERWVSDEMSELMDGKLTPRESKLARKGRRKKIAEGLIPVEANAKLFLAFTRHQVRSIRRRPPGPRSERDRLMEDLYDLCQHCCLLLAFAKASRILLAWDTQRLIKFHRAIVMNEVRELLILFLRLSATYGEHCRENLLMALDVWELAEDNF